LRRRIATDFITIGQLAQERFGWKLFTVMRYLPENEEVERVHTSDAAAYPLSGRKRKRGTEWSRKVLLRGEPHFAADAQGIRAAFDDAETILALGVGALINVPVRATVGGRVIGTLNFGADHRGYTPEDVERALAVAALAGPLLETSQT
jgi:GAF domain-containing protein